MSSIILSGYLLQSTFSLFLIEYTWQYNQKEVEQQGETRFVLFPMMIALD
ncbi:hypothetical protein [Candidatus Nitrosocosmicus sp. SS]|jgi:hypothetical protein|nr:hypothetical protein [Candidatus Nitrosocosmicus sp. SS]MDR4490526.1 hypothetical protein [Candidatus Nitrosocosmicus sp.]